MFEPAETAAEKMRLETTIDEEEKEKENVAEGGSFQLPSFPGRKDFEALNQAGFLDGYGELDTDGNRSQRSRRSCFLPSQLP